MGSQKTCEITLEEPHTNKELHFSWSKNSPAIRQANGSPDLEVEASLLDRGNSESISLSKQTLRRGIRTLPAVSSQHQENVAKPLPAKIIPPIGVPKSPFSADNVKFHPRKKLKNSRSQFLCGEVQRRVYPARKPYGKESDLNLNEKELGEAASGSRFPERGCSDAQEHKSCQSDFTLRHAAKLHPDGGSLALAASSQPHSRDLSLKENDQCTRWSEGPVSMSSGRPLQSSPRGGSTLCGILKSSSTVLQGETHAPQKPKESDRVTEMSKTSLDHHFDEQPTEEINFIRLEMQSQKASGRSSRALESKLLSDKDRASQATACFHGRSSTGGGCHRLDFRGETVKLDILSDACTKVSKMSSAFSKVTSTDRGVPGHSVGFKKGFMQGIKVESEPFDISTSLASRVEANPCSSCRGQSISGDSRCVKEVVTSFNGIEAGRSLPRSRHMMFSAHAPMPVAASTFSFGEPSLPLLANCLQKPSEATKVSSPCYKDCSAVTHLPYPDLQKFPSCSQSPETVALKNASHGQALLVHQKRFIDLQAFLRLCDEADQVDLLQALRSLSTAGRIGHAFNLETRALRLSIEEGKEMIRLKMLNVMGRSLQPKHQTSDAGATPAGLRLRAPGYPTASSSQNA